MTGWSKSLPLVALLFLCGINAGVTLEVKESEEGGWGGWSGRNDEASSSNGDEDEPLFFHHHGHHHHKHHLSHHHGHHHHKHHHDSLLKQPTHEERSGEAEGTHFHSDRSSSDASSLLPIGSTSKTRPFGGRRGELSKDLPRTLASLSSHLAARRAEADRSLGGEKHASRTKETTEEDAMAHPVLSQISGGGKERKAPVASPAHPAPRAWTPASSLSPAAQSRVPLPVPLPTLESVSSAPQAPAAAEVSRGPQEAALPLKHSNEAFARQAGHPSVPSSHLHLQSNSGSDSNGKDEGSSGNEDDNAADAVTPTEKEGIRVGMPQSLSKDTYATSENRGTCYPLSTSAEDHTYRYDNHEVHFVPGGTTIGAKPQDVLSVEFGSKEQDRAKFFRVLYRARETGEKRWSVWLVGHQKEKEEHHETHKYVEVKEINSDVVDGKAEPPIHKMDLAQHEEECESGNPVDQPVCFWLYRERRMKRPAHTDKDPADKPHEEGSLESSFLKTKERLRQEPEDSPSESGGETVTYKQIRRVGSLHKTRKYFPGEGGLSRFIRWLFGIRRVQWVDMVEYYFVDSNGKWQKGQPVEGWIQNRPKVFSVVEERLYTMQFGTPCPEVGSDEETDEGPLTESADS